MRNWLILAACAVVLPACGDDATDAETVDHTSVVSALLHDDSGDYVVEVTHDEERVSRAEARRLARDVILEKTTTNRVAFADGVVPAANDHWDLENDHGFKVVVRSLVDDRVDRRVEREWAFAEEIAAFLHCPPGH